MTERDPQGQNNKEHKDGAKSTAVGDLCILANQTILVQSVLVIEETWIS